MSATELNDNPGAEPQAPTPDEATNRAAAAETDPSAELREQLEAANAKAAEHWDRVLRMQAEMENQRKRAQRDIENAHKYALENFASQLLAVRDSLEMGLDAARKEDASLQNIVDGTELTLKMLVQVMDKFNIEAIDPLGEKFNPELHQAMTMQSVEGAEPNSVTQVIQKGYKLNDRLMRPALVAVAS